MSSSGGVAVAGHNSSASRSPRRSVSRTRADLGSPAFRARSLSPSGATNLLESTASLDTVAASSSASSARSSSLLRGRKRDAGTSGSDRSTSTSPPSSSSSKSLQKVDEVSSSLQALTSETGAKTARLPVPFYPRSLIDDRAKLNTEGGRSTGQDLPSVPSEPQVTTVDEQDVSTPDKWVRRDSRLVRLTGKHPFNVEAKIADLFNAGFLTPSNLFYVRSHGACVKVSEQEARDWKIDFTGLIDRPCQLSVQDLCDKFDVVTLPITLVCAGNRRKEQNMIQKGLGFSWGAGGCSTALFTGVYLSDVLAYLKPQKKAKHVIFEGADPLPKGPYGTSQTLKLAADQDKGMLLCWAMNGLPLEPDHGFPIRVVIPGQIGGRSVKWLTKVDISDKESQHYLHFWDNKVLPTEVTPDQARNEAKWWYDNKYLITDLNVNSAIAFPDHDEVLSVKSKEATYDIKGYAYTGGGRRVTRIEISLDDGQTWRISDINYAEDLYRSVVFQDPVYGTLDMNDRETSYCWCFWKFSVSTAELQQASVICVRAMDSAMNMQPRDMYWNPTGMMNNWWFRVAVHKLENGDLKFEHPTMAGTQPGGWMPRMVEAGLDALKPVFASQSDVNAVASTSAAPALVKKVEIPMIKAGVDRKITRAELEAHNTEHEPWFVVKNEVYDGTAFLSGHPGGPESITLVAGEDATTEFMSIHSSDAKKQLIDYHIGTLVPDDAITETARAVDNVKEPMDAVFLHKKKWKRSKLVSIEKMSHDSRIYRFALETPEQPLGLPIGQHVFARLRRKVKPTDDPAVVEGELVQRAYTPVSRSDAKGFLDLLIKVYFPTSDYPLGGKMTGGFEELLVGDEVEFRGPLGSFEYCGNGLTKHRGAERTIRKFGLICGGSGITPILQVLRGILQDASDQETEIWIVNANKTYEDILCREELHALQSQYPGRYRLHHTLSAIPEQWQYSKGRMNVDMLKKHLPPPVDDALCCICGPDAMIHKTVKPALMELGWDVDTRLVVF